MNWIGGSRSRIFLKKERRKQKEYFERKKLTSKWKLLETASPKNTSVSLDLLNLYIVNQISKKEITSKKALQIDINKATIFPVERNNIELPMSPNTVPSKICLEDYETNDIPGKKPLCVYPDGSVKKLSEEEDIKDLQNENMRRKDHLDNENNNILIGSQSDLCTKYAAEENDVWLKRKYKEISENIKLNTFSLHCDASPMHSIGNEATLDISEKQDACSQTDSNTYVSRKCNVAIQCNILQKCVYCTRNKIPDTSINLSTTRVQHTPPNDMSKRVYKEYAVSNTVKLLETEYLAMEGNINLDMLN